MSTRAGVRIGLVGVFALLAIALTVGDAWSQPRPGGITGRPGTGSITGMTRPPNFPTPPSITPTPIPSPPSFNPPSMPRGPQFETVWTCGKCNAELGRGNVKPSYDSCPRCGVRFVNGGGGGGFSLVSPPLPQNFSSPPPAANSTDPDLFPRGSGGPASSGPSESARPAPESSSSSSDPGPGKTGSLVLKIMLGVFGVMFLLGIIGGICLIVAANRGSKPTRRARREDLDDDD
jgi:hypothetical protein